MNETTVVSPPPCPFSGVRWFLAAVVIATTFTASFFVTKALRTTAGRDSLGVHEDSLRAVQSFASGRHLVALVFLSSHCGFCTEKQMKAGLRKMRSALLAANAYKYSKISVVGIAVDQDIHDGFDYLAKLGPIGEVFDEVSIGRGWLNQFVTEIVWREGIGQPSTPQVVLLTHLVNASNFPRFIDIGQDSVVRVIRGRDSLLAWISAGTPIAPR